MTRLDGQRIYLRPLATQDTDTILRWRSDPAVISQLFSDRAPTREEHEAWLARLQTRTDRQEFVIVLCEGDLPVGTIGLSDIDLTRGTAEYGIMLGEAAWRGKGLAREASELILRYAFKQLGVQTVELNLFADNTAAYNLYLRLGFVELPARAGQREKAGHLRSTLTMSLAREKWILHE